MLTSPGIHVLNYWCCGAPLMRLYTKSSDSLISTSQIVFIKHQCIHNSFMYVQETIRGLHKKKIPAIFIKLDISKFFDIINWPYLLDIMSYLGFGQKWRNWMSSLWCTVSSSVLLNEEPSSRVL
jgi:hypothetical protein